MSDEQTCQFLGHPSDGFFYYRNLKTNELIAVESSDEVDRFIAGDFKNCPRHIVVDEHRPIFVCARGVGIRNVDLDVFLPFSTEDDGELQVCVSLKDLLWLLERRHVPHHRVMLGEGLEQVRLLFLALFTHASQAICGAGSDGKLEDY